MYTLETPCSFAPSYFHTIITKFITSIHPIHPSNPSYLTHSSQFHPHQDYIDGDAPILLATSLGDTVMVELLLRHGANRAITASKGNSCLHIAVKKPDRDYSKEMVRLLLHPDGTPSLREILDVHDFQVRNWTEIIPRKGKGKGKWLNWNLCSRGHPSHP